MIYTNRSPLPITTNAVTDFVVRDYSGIAALLSGAMHLHWTDADTEIVLDPRLGAFAVITAYADDRTDSVEIYVDYFDADDRVRADIAAAFAANHMQLWAENGYAAIEMDEWGARPVGVELVSL